MTLTVVIFFCESPLSYKLVAPTNLSNSLISRWLLDSAARSGKVTISVISSGLVAGLKLSVSRNDMTLLTPRISQQGHRHRSRSHESLNRIRVKRLLGQQKPQEIKRSHTQIVKSNVSQEKASSSHSSLHLRPGFAPSIGSRHGSDYSLVSSIVDTAAYYARSSIRSSRDGGVSGPTSKVIIFMIHMHTRDHNNYYDIMF